MKALIIYDSDFGNTAKIAHAIEQKLKMQYETVAFKAADVTPDMVDNADLLVVGSPTQGGRATVYVQECIARLPDLSGVQVAAFDTRFAEREHGPFLRVLMKVIGYAADKIAADLKAKGGTLAAQPEGFIVNDKEGPLAEGEMDRASEWAVRISLANTKQVVG